MWKSRIVCLKNGAQYGNLDVGVRKAEQSRSASRIMKRKAAACIALGHNDEQSRNALHENIWMMQRSLPPPSRTRGPTLPDECI